MELLSRILTRKNFLLASITVATVSALMGLKRTAVGKKTKMKFLTREGKLVEIDVDRLPASKRPASIADVQQWINTK